MATIDNRVIARKLYDDFNKHDLEALAAVCAEDVKYTDMANGQTYEGPMGFRAASERWLSAFPDAKIEILSQLVGDDLAVTEFVGRGTQSGVLTDPSGGSIQPTGKKGELSCCEIFRLRDGKIVSGRIYYDSLTLLRQLGVAPGLAPERPLAPAQPQP